MVFWIEYSRFQILDSSSACTRVFIRRTKGKRKEKMRNAIVSIKIQHVSDPAYAPGTVATWKSVAATGTALEMAKIDRSKLGTRR